MAPHSSTFAQKIPWKEEPGRLQSMGSLESDMTRRLRFHFSLSGIGEGGGSLLQCSCLENPRDWGAWWAAVYGVAQSRTRLKLLGSNSSSVLLPGKSHGWRSLVGCSPWGRQELDTTERLHFHFSLACIGEGNGNPLQCSCLENPRDGEAWWAAICGVAQNQTRVKRLSSSSSIPRIFFFSSSYGYCLVFPKL